MSRPPALGDPAVATCFSVVGEHRADPDRLLLLGDDGRYYDLHLPDGSVVPAEPEAGEWTVDPEPPATEDLLA